MSTSPASFPSVRVGDRERTEAAERLADHAAAGRLSVDELEERLERAQSAVFARDLDAVESDLPQPGRPARVRPPGHTGPIALAAVACLALGILATALVGHPMVPLFVLAAVLWHTARWGGPRSSARRSPA